ncbi:putative 2-components response regulator protein [Listeria floridensis FSL S10-1187]|uniref:2-components response regulator protein n=1 Tax=Listeria floridensis FSL S10-1187 TaxID=1265817 RepID=A0ABP3AY45_9LIST|nr:LytTR family DNA-binding domain-containing protein [Listeria floridensis]EUJ30997.1 putative 2-components response regulator protein [Listeria floridensis FSL S10-1187]
MLPIFICEDNKIQRERLEKNIEDFIMLEHYDMELVKASADPNEILEAVKEQNSLGLYFLDIDLQQPELNGFELAKEIRKLDPRGFIIFITTHAELTYLTFTYKVEALDYIIKDNISEVKERVHACLDSVQQRLLDDREMENYFTFHVTEKKVIHEKIDDILFFETSSKIHKIVMHGKNRQIEFYAKMKQIEKLLGEPFYRCHRSFLVNKNNISEVDVTNGTITMSNGETCIASNKLIKGLKL